MAPRRLRNKTKQQCTKHRMPWGYDAPSKDTTPLNDFIKYITDPQVKPAQAGEMKNVLVYWDRGTLTKGDEAKLAEMDINSDTHFAHVIDCQDWIQQRFPKGVRRNEKHNLAEAAAIMSIKTVSQVDLDNMTETERAYNVAAMRHNAAGDAEMTLRVFIAVIRDRPKEMCEEDGETPEIREDFCFVALDFEGGGRTGQGTIEIGLSQVFTDQMGAQQLLEIQTRHAIIYEHFDQHINRTAQDGKMQIDDRESATYPRWNFTGGPNTTEKVDVCFPQGYRRHQVIAISVDSEIVSKQHMAWWIIHQLPGSHKQPFGPPCPAAAGPTLTQFTGCKHSGHKHERKAHPRDDNGIMIRPPRQNDAQRRAAEESEEEYDM